MIGNQSVSVIIPAYDVQDCISRAINSVLKQSIASKEILVIDDGSTDATCQAAHRFGTPVRVLSQGHCGAAAARNAGIRASTGDIIAFLDADDEWLDGKLEKQLRLHQARTLAASFCRSNEFDAQGADLGDTFRNDPPRRGTEIWRDLLAANFIATPTVMASRAAINAAGGFDTALKVGEDQDMWIRLALQGYIDYVDESLVQVHQRANSLSNSGFEDQINFTLPMIWKHLETLKPRLSERDIRRMRAMRLGRLGRNAYANGELRLALPLMARAVLSGDSLPHNLYHLAAGSPSTRSLCAAAKHRFFSRAGERTAAAIPAGERTH
jgi:glycosyltransferase involved in cell wall biosynthesis